MIQASFLIDQDENFLDFVVTGHAEYAEKGQDIVCAAVTALVVSTYNSVEKLLFIELPYESAEAEGGYLRVECGDYKNDPAWRDIQFLMSHLYGALEDIQKEYPDYIVLNRIKA